MNSENNHIDDIISETLTGASVDASGIGWDSFQQKKNKRLAIFWAKIAGVIVIVGTSLMILKSSINTANETIIEHSESISIIKDTLNDAELDQSNNLSKFEPSTSENPKKKTQQTNPSKISLKEYKHQTKTATEKSESVISTGRSIQVLNITPKKLKAFDYGFPLHNSLEPYTNEAFSLLDTIIKESDTKRSFVKLGLSSSFSSPSLTLGKQGEVLVHKDYSSIRNSSENGAVGYQFNVVGGLTFNRVSPFVGIGFAKNVASANYNFEYSEKPVLDLDGTIIGYQNESPTTVQYSSKHQYALINLPLGIEFKLIDKNGLNVSLVSLLNTQIVTKSAGTTPNPLFLNEQNRLSLNQFKLNTYSYGIGLNLTKKLNNYSWYFEPTYNFGSAIHQVNNLYSTSFNSLVVTFGIRK